MKYPIGIQTFERIIEDGFAYVDKTALVYKLVTEGRIYFLSRPRRFGKSLLVSTLANYFEGNNEIFQGLAIADLEKDWKQYPVFRFDFNGPNYTVAGTLEQKIEGTIGTWEDQWGSNPRNVTYGDRLAYIFQQAHKKTGRRAVVLVDEYDKPLLDVVDLEEYGKRNGKDVLLEDINRDILKNLYSVFKSADADLQFVFLTGVTKFSQVSVFSGFNQPQDISMAPAYATLCGITDDELQHYFAEPIAELAERYKMTYDEMRARLRRQYDGYHFCDDVPGVYNPFSVLNCFAGQRIYDYWFASGTPTYLVRLLDGSEADIDDMIATEHSAADFMNSKAIKAQPLPMIYQSGYLTIKDYNIRRDTYRLGFPNREVQNGFISVISANYFNRSEMRPTAWIDAVADTLEAGDIEKFQKNITALLARTTYRFQRKKETDQCERFFHYTFYLILQMIGFYTVYAERETSEGRIDCTIEAGDYVYVIEIKLDGSADEALQQIRDRGYLLPYADDTRHIIALAINFSSQTGNIEEMKSLKIKN